MSNLSSCSCNYKLMKELDTQSRIIEMNTENKNLKNKFKRLGKNIHYKSTTRLNIFPGEIQFDIRGRGKIQLKYFTLVYSC